MKLGYLLSRYPLISETFILREMLELRRLGHEIEIAPLLQVSTPVRHADTFALAGQVAWQPWLSAALLEAQLRWLGRHPMRTAAAWLEAVAGSASDRNLLAGALLFWPRAVAIAERFRRAGVEHVHAHYGTHPALVALVIHRLTGIPFSFTVHAHDLFVHPRMLPEKTAAAAFVAVISDYNQRRLQQLCQGAPTGHIHVIRCGVRPEDYRPRRREPASGPLRILTVASLQPYKGHRYLLEACARLRERLAFECRFIGGGELESELRRQIARLGLQQHVKLLGPAPEDQVRQELAGADLFVLPSIQEPSGKMEGIPVALMEAMASGLPVVASRLSGIPELVEDQHSGFLVEAGDSEALAAAILRLDSAPLRWRMGEVGRERVCRDYDLHRNVRQLAHLFLHGRNAPQANEGMVAA